MKAKIIIFSIFWGVVILFALYGLELHLLAVKGNNIFAKRCTTVNPALIAYKNSFFDFVDSLKNPENYTSEQIAQFYNDYVDGMIKYVPIETSWIDEYSDYVNSWNFKLFEPWYIKKAALYQIEMYKGYRDEAQSVADAVSQKITNDELNDRFSDARNRRNEYSNLYYDFSEEAYNIFDIRKIFGDVPLPKECNEENLTIPDTTGALDDKPLPTPKTEYGNSV